MSGFTKIQNDFLDSKMSQIKHSSLALYLAILRYTAGYGRNSVQISIKELMQATGISKRDTVHACIDELKAANLITVQSSIGEMNTYTLLGMPKNTDEGVPKKGVSQKLGYPENQDRGYPENWDRCYPENQDRGYPENGDTNKERERKNKERERKGTRENALLADASLPLLGGNMFGGDGSVAAGESVVVGERSKPKAVKFRAEDIALPDCIARDDWVAFVEFRREMKKPLSEVAANRAVRQIVNLHEAFGNDTADIIWQSIDNDWQGLFQVKADYAAMRCRLKTKNAMQQFIEKYGDFTKPHKNIPDFWDVFYESGGKFRALDMSDDGTKYLITIVDDKGNWSVPEWRDLPAANFTQLRDGLSARYRSLIKSYSHCMNNNIPVNADIMRSVKFVMTRNNPNISVMLPENFKVDGNLNLHKSGAH